MSFCRKCGRKLDEDERFCSDCGTLVKEVPGEFSDRPVFSAQEQEERKEEKRVKKTTIGILALVGGLILLFLIFGSSGQVCDRCGDSFRGAAYYDSWDTEETTWCEDCAREYYSPLPYENFKK